MATTSFDLTAMRHIRQARDIGSAADGQAVTLNLDMEGGGSEWFAVHHARVGRLVAALLFGAGVAADDRRTARESGAASAEQSSLIDITRINASSASGADHVCLRVVVGEGANLDFRIPLAVVPALQEKIALALAAARSGAATS
jgi:hypothetical protein